MSMARSRNRGGRRKTDGRDLLPSWYRAPCADAYHQRMLFLFDEALGSLLRKHPEAEAELEESAARVFEIPAAAARESAAARRSVSARQN